jgi:retron-type reverse transcriptase
MTIWNYLGYSPDSVQSVLADLPNQYKSYRIEKRSGSYRRIDAPKRLLLLIQQSILYKILYLFKAHPIAHGFIKHKSPKTSAMVHLGKQFVATIDIKDFFPTIKEDRVKALFKFLLPKQYLFDVTEEDYDILTSLVCYKHRLPQGAPTSPTISNLVCLHLDAELAKLAIEQTCVVTRYADDVTISKIEKPENVKELLLKFQAIIKIHGYEINKKKLRYRYHWKRQLVNGIVVNTKLNTPKEYWRNLRAEIHNLKSNNILITEKSLQILKGKIEWVRTLNHQRGNQLSKQLEDVLASR